MKETKWDGLLEMSFRAKKNDIFYYDVLIHFGKKKVKFILPRYQPMVGWIEVFGLPPQNEWVFLDNERKAWQKTASFDFEINDKKFKMKEMLEVFPDIANKRRSLELTRTMSKETESQSYQEDWSEMDAKNTITKRSVFRHSEGHYFIDETVIFNPPIETLSSEQKNFVATIKKEHGDPSLGIWLKRSTMSGKYPPMYSKLFPFWGKDILEAKYVESIELGYEVAQAHGDWYKLFEIAGKTFEIMEDNYTEREELYKNKKTKIKNTYRKRIKRIS